MYIGLVRILAKSDKEPYTQYYTMSIHSINVL